MAEQTSEPLHIRPSVMAFAFEMEKKLRQKDVQNPEGWRYCTIEYLRGRLIEEGFEYWHSRQPKELIDIANFCMMVWQAPPDCEIREKVITEKRFEAVCLNTEEVV
jgi:hypothetical protein